MSADLNWDWRTLCVCFYLADLGWALDILGLVGSRLLWRALARTAALSSVYSFLLQQAEFPKTAEGAKGRDMLGKGTSSLSPCSFGQSQSTEPP